METIQQIKRNAYVIVLPLSNVHECVFDIFHFEKIKHREKYQNLKKFGFQLYRKEFIFSFEILNVNLTRTSIERCKTQMYDVNSFQFL